MIKANAFTHRLNLQRPRLQSPHTVSIYCQLGCTAPKLLTLSSLNVTVFMSAIAAFCVRTLSITPDGLPCYCRDHHRTGLYMGVYEKDNEGIKQTHEDILLLTMHTYIIQKRYSYIVMAKCAMKCMHTVYIG